MSENSVSSCASLRPLVKASGESILFESYGVICRAFVNSNYAQIKAADPKFPFIVRECEGAQPCVTARYDYGVERKVYVHDCNSAEVGQALDELVEQASKINSSAATRF